MIDSSKNAGPAEASPHVHLPPMIETEGGLAPEAPATIKSTGIERATLLDLALKAAYVVSQFTTESAAHRLHLPQAITSELLEQLRTDAMLEVLGRDGPFGYRYTLSQRGRERAVRLLDISGYIGPAPVSLEAYSAMLNWQSDQHEAVAPDDVRQALAQLTLPEEAIEVAGYAISSGRSLFLSGPPGNGKTSLGRQIHSVFRGTLWIPHCLSVDNNIIRLYDPHCHEEVGHAAGKHQMIDARWIKIRRPFIVVGGEMTLASLDLAYLPALRYYEAPLHMKANGGTFLIDDFGRQHVAPEELLNRWIIPLEHQIDFLTLYSGQKIEVPFKLMLIIATNLEPKDVTDPAFLRRIGYRVRLDAPSESTYAHIFTQYARSCGIDVSEALIAKLFERYRRAERELRACEPRDLIERVKDICRHRQQPLAIDETLLGLAWNGYFGKE